MASIQIHWSDLIAVAEVSFAFGVGIVVVFTLGVLGLAQVDKAGDVEQSSGARARGYLVAGLALTVCAVAVVYGLYLIIPQFHR